MPRSCTPSDIDMVMDNDGDILQFELDDGTASWEFLKRGQRRLQRSYVEAGRGKITSVLLWHRVPDSIEQEIDTTRDIVQFSLMRWVDGRVVETGPFPGDKFVRYVEIWWKRKVNK